MAELRLTDDQVLVLARVHRLGTITTAVPLAGSDYVQFVLALARIDKAAEDIINADRASRR